MQVADSWRWLRRFTPRNDSFKTFCEFINVELRISDFGFFYDIAFGAGFCYGEPGLSKPAILGKIRKKH
jgi:hypothetical protein